MFFVKLNNLNLINPDIVLNICNELILDTLFFKSYKKKILKILNKTLIISLININSKFLELNFNNNYILFLFLHEKDIDLYKDLKLNYKKIFIFPSVNIVSEIIPIECSENVINFNNIGDSKFILICNLNNFIKINKYDFIFDYYQDKIFIIKIYLCFLNSLIYFLKQKTFIENFKLIRCFLNYYNYNSFIEAINFIEKQNYKQIEKENEIYL